MLLVACCLLEHPQHRNAIGNVGPQQHPVLYSPLVYFPRVTPLETPFAPFTAIDPVLYGTWAAT